jgi:hypothetical protein
LVAAASLEHLGAQAAPAPPVKKIRSKVLEIGYHETGNAD